MSAIRMVFDQIDRFECEHSLQLAEILSDDSTRQQHNAKVSPQQRNEVKQERVDWNAVYQQACERDFRECPICMTSLTNSNNSRMIALLSCGHVYHGNCIGNFEKFRSEDGNGSGKIINNTCPCCRQFYQKRLFDSIMLGLQSVE
jgi:hypothetical protein